MNDTREKIIETAFVLLVKNGYNGVSIGDITGALDITRSLPYRYFESKRELLFEACRQYFFERFFPKDFDVKSATMEELLEVISENMERIIFGLSKSLGAEVSVFDYNLMYFDALRILAILLVIFNHLPGYTLYQTCAGPKAWLYMLITMLTRINVPLFLMVSGALLLGRSESVPRLLRHRALRIVGAIVVFGSLCFLS